MIHVGSAMKKSLVTDSAGWCFSVYSAHKTHEQKDANSFVFVIKIKISIEGAEPR